MPEKGPSGPSDIKRATGHWKRPPFTRKTPGENNPAVSFLELTVVRYRKEPARLVEVQRRAFGRPLWNPDGTPRMVQRTVGGRWEKGPAHPSRVVLPYPEHRDAPLADSVGGAPQFFRYREILTEDGRLTFKPSAGSSRPRVGAELMYLGERYVVRGADKGTVYLRRASAPDARPVTNTAPGVFKVRPDGMPYEAPIEAPMLALGGLSPLGDIAVSRREIVGLIPWETARVKIRGRSTHGHSLGGSLVYGKAAEAWTEFLAYLELVRYGKRWASACNACGLDSCPSARRQGAPCPKGRGITKAAHKRPQGVKGPAVVETTVVRRKAHH